MAFSRRHYRAVSPREDTPAEIAARLKANEVDAQVRAEVHARWPFLAPGAPRPEDEGVALAAIGEALAFQSERRRELRVAAGLLP